MDTAPRIPGRAFFGIAVLLLFTGCNPKPIPLIVPYAQATSPDGSVEASVFERSGDAGMITEVLLAFANGCGSGTVSAYRLGLKLELRWIDNENLEVIHPPGVEFRRNASGETIQCKNQRVRVQLVARAR